MIHEAMSGYIKTMIFNPFVEDKRLSMQGMNVLDVARNKRIKYTLMISSQVSLPFFHVTFLTFIFLSEAGLEHQSKDQWIHFLLFLNLEILKNISKLLKSMVNGSFSAFRSFNNTCIFGLKWFKAKQRWACLYLKRISWKLFM